MRVKYIGKSDTASLLHGKVYDVLGIEKGWYRIVDEEGEDPDEDVQGYLYSPEQFEIVED